MAAHTTPPPAGTFNYVLRRHRSCKFDPSLRNTVTSYIETVESRDITHNDGLRAQTVFVKQKFFRDRLWRKGWEDVTEMWFASNHPTGIVGQTDSHTLARQALAIAQRDGGVEKIDG